MVAVPCLVGVAAARDDVHPKAAAAQLVEGRELPRGKSGRDEARPVRQQELQRLGHGCGVRADHETVGRVGEVADQHTVETAALVDVRSPGDHSGVERRAFGRHHLRGDSRCDPTDHLNRHDADPARFTTDKRARQYHGTSRRARWPNSLSTEA